MNMKSSPRIPAPDSFINPLKVGTLLKRTGKRFLRKKAWKPKYCVIDDFKLYFYPNENSIGNEKNCGIVNLKYFDSCVDLKHGSNTDKEYELAFVVHQSEKLGFFDSKHIFCGASESDKNQWMKCINSVLSNISMVNNKIRENDDTQKRKSVNLDKISSHDQKLNLVTKDRAKGPKGRRPPNRKSEYPNALEVSDDKRPSSSQETASDSTGDGEEMDEGVMKMIDENEDGKCPERDEVRQGDCALNRQSTKMGTWVKEFEQSWPKEEDGAAKEKSVVISEPNFAQTRQISVTSNRSSDPSSTYQLYLLDKEIRTLKRDVNSFLGRSSNNNALQARTESLEKQVDGLKDEMNAIKIVIDDIAAKMDTMMDNMNIEEEDTLV